MIPAALIAGTNLVGGIANFFANASANERAQMAQDEGLQEWLRINVPSVDEQRLIMQQLVQQGTLTPELEAAIEADPSRFQSITTAARDRNAQTRALEELQQIGNQGGLRLQDKAALQDAMINQQVQDRAGRDSIQSEMERRGLGGSGFDVAARLSGAQGGSDQMARNSLSVAAQAQDRALKALMGAGELGTKYREQDFSEQAERARAADSINRFNTQNLRDVQQRNLGNRNRAAELNLGEKQRISDQNVRNANYANEYNSRLVDQNFQNNMAKAKGAQGYRTNKANLGMDQAKETGNLFTNLTRGAGDLMTTANRWESLDDFFEKQKHPNGYAEMTPEMAASVDKVREPAYPQSANQRAMSSSVDKIRGDDDWDGSVVSDDYRKKLKKTLGQW